MNCVEYMPILGSNPTLSDLQKCVSKLKQEEMADIIIMLCAIVPETGE